MAKVSIEDRAKQLTIAGTDFDRRRKVTKAMKLKMDKLVAQGKSLTSIADTFGVTPYAVKTNTNKAFRDAEHARRAQYPSYESETNVSDIQAYKEDLIRSRRKVEVWVK